MNPRLLQFVHDFPRNRLADLDLHNSVKVEDDSQRVVTARHPDIDDFAAAADLAASQFSGDAAVLEFNQLLDEVEWFYRLSDMDSCVLLEEGFRWIQTVDCRDGSNRNHIGSRDERGHGCESLLLDSLVHLKLLVDVEVSLG